MKVFEKKLLRIIFGSKKEKLILDLIKLCNEIFIIIPQHWILLR
jgi:hypothetical protein